MARHAQTNCFFLFIRNQSLRWWESRASTEWIRKMSRWGNDLSCSILQVQDFHVKTKQQQEKPTQTCLTSLLCPTAGPPARVDGKSVLTVPSSHLRPFSSAQLSSPCDAVKPPASSTPQATADTPGPLQATHAL